MGLAELDQFLAEPSAPPSASDDMGPVRGGIADTLGLTDRPGARTPVDVLVRPKGVAEHVAQGMVTAPLIAAGGLAAGAAAKGLPLVAKAAPVVGRIVAAGGIGAGQAAANDRSALWNGVLDAVVAGVTEGALGGGGRLLKGAGAAVRGSEWAKGAPAQALAAIRARVGNGRWVNAPSMSPTALTPTEAVERLATLRGPAYRQARAELASEFNRLDMQMAAGGPRPAAGQVFKDQTAKYLVEPSGFARVAEAVRRGTASTAGRSAADAAMIAPALGGLPLGLGVGMATTELPSLVTRHAIHKALP